VSLLSDLFPPFLFVVALWWAGTGLILFLDGLPRRSFRWTLAGCTGLLALSLWAAARLRDDPGTAGAYLGFAAGFGVWAWQETVFLLGYVTGPRKAACPEGCRGWRHFTHGVEAVLYHELALAGGALLLWAVTAGGTNRIAFWAYLILWGMRESAKLNLFLGVRNPGRELLPPDLRYLGSFLRTRPMNALFPFSVTGGTLLTVLLAWTVFLKGGPAGPSLLTALAALGLLEHWMLMTPVSLEPLWSGWTRIRARVLSEGADPDAATAPGSPLNEWGEPRSERHGVRLQGGAPKG